MITLNLIIGGLSLAAAIIAAYYSRETYWSNKTPKIVLESPFNDSLEMRNIGTDIAKSIVDSNGVLKNLPHELWPYTGVYDYMREKNPGIVKSVGIEDHKRPKPSDSVVVRVEYCNSSGDKFFTEVKITRSDIPTGQRFSSIETLRWGRA